MEDGGPSQTARRVAAHRLDFTRIPADYGAPAADHVLAVDVAAGRQAPAYTETIPDSTAAAGKAGRPRSVTP